MPPVRVARASELAAARHHVTLRHADTKEYHSVLLYSFAGNEGTDYYCMEATCPHLGAPLENAHVEHAPDDVEDLVVVCPWHQYDFSLSTGESSTGLQSCVYGVTVDDGTVYIDTPTPDARWTVVDVRPVSEDIKSAAPPPETGAVAEKAQHAAQSFDPSAIPPPDPAPRTLIQWAVLVLNTPEPLKKVAYTRYAGDALRHGECRVIGGTAQADGSMRADELPPDTPPRLDSEVCVAPGTEGKRGKGGTERSRIALLHSLANIEQWAIDLAWDIIARAPRLAARMPGGIRMPVQFFSDFVKVACDEAKHFTLLQRRLLELGSYFGALPVHHGLWQSARETSDDLLARLCTSLLTAIIHLVHEARGLDVNPVTIKKFAAAQDSRSVDVRRC